MCYAEKVNYFSQTISTIFQFYKHDKFPKSPRFKNTKRIRWKSNPVPSSTKLPRIKLEPKEREEREEREERWEQAGSKTPGKNEGGGKEGGGSLAFNHHPGQNVVTGFIVPRPLLTSRNIIASSLGNAGVSMKETLSWSKRAIRGGSHRRVVTNRKQLTIFIPIRVFLGRV